MMQAKLTITGKNAGTLGWAVEPDNLPEMIMKAQGDDLSFELSVKKIGTLLATLDDLLMNVKIAEDILSIGEIR